MIAKDDGHNESADHAAVSGRAPRGQAALRESERLACSTVDALSAHIAILDESGCIVAVNRAWRNFAQANHPHPSSVCEGANYFAVCDGVRGVDADQAAPFAAGMRAVMRGEQNVLELEYPCHSPNEQRWFNVRVTRFLSAGAARVVVAHEDITGRKQVEARLRESEEKYRSLFEHMTQGVFYQGPDGVLLDANPAALHMFGLSLEEFLGRASGDRRWDVIREDGSAFHGADHPSMVAMETGAPVRDVVAGVFNPQRGEYVWMIISAIPELRPGETVPYRAFVTLHEITRRKKDEQALRKSEEHFRTVVENVPNAIFVLVQGRFIYLNKAAVDLFGARSQDQLLGSPVVDRLHPDCREIIGERMRLLTLEKIHVPRLEHQYMRLDGSLVDVQASGVPFNHDGMDGALIFVRNITKEKRTEEALRGSEAKYKVLSQQFRAVLEAIPDCLSVISPDLTIAWANRNAVESMRGGAECLPGDHCHKRWHLRPGPCEKCPFPGALKTGEPMTELISAPDGKMWEYRLIPVKDDTGMVVNAVRLGRDISELRKLEAQLRQAQKMEAIGTLAGGIAHDFNNILAAMIGYTEMALERVADEEPARSDLSQVLKAGGRARDLVRQILSFARSKRQEGQQAVPIHSVLREALNLLRATLPATIEIQQDFEPSHVLALADPSQIHQIIMNLATNAAHAMRNQMGVLSISTTRVAVGANDVVGSPHLPPGMYLRITVADTGCGMSQDILHRIFEPYFTTKGADQGSGLGLAVVHGIVVRHGGAIRVESKPGTGTRFQIFLPCVETPIVDREALPSGIPRGTERVLVIDDEETIAILLRKMLVSLGYHVLSQTSPAEALNAFREDPGRFDLIITDYTMPKMTGLELAQTMMRLRGDIPIILLTGYNEMVNEEEALRMGFRGFAYKPLDRDSLARLIRHVIDGAGPRGS